MNVLLIITNIDGFHEVPYSFGLASIASMAESKGHQTKIVPVSDKAEYDRVISELKLLKPAVVGFTAVSSQFSHVKELATIIKQYSPEALIVCGGVHPTLYPESIRECKSLDALFIGESELAFAEFLDKLQAGLDYHDTHNLVYLKDGKLIANPLRPIIADLSTLPFPKKDALYATHIKATKHATFLFSRGCPYNCAYCSNHALAKIYGKKSNAPRYRNVESSIREIKDAQKNFFFNRVNINDDLFGLDKKWLLEFTRLYKKEINLPFLCLLRVNVATEDVIQMLKKAGCYGVSFGVESGNEHIRNDVMNRHISESQIVDAFKFCKKYKLNTTALNIIGVPGETDSMIWDTIRLNRKIGPTNSGINIFYPYKGTRLGDFCFENNLVDIDLYNNFSRERRESVLNLPRATKNKLIYYQRNWSALVDPFSLKKRVLSLAGTHSSLFKVLRFAYRLPLNIAHRIKELFWEFRN